MADVLNLSCFGTKLSEESGILNLMNDLGEAVALRPDMLMLGGGNPAYIPEVQKIWRDNAKKFISNQEAFDKSLVCYDAPQGDPGFLNAFADLFRNRFGLPITSKNVAVVSGVQLGAFCLLNLLAGRMPDGRNKKILIPVSPEYVGYADMGIDLGLFVACPGRITYPDPDDRTVFKYAVDFDALDEVVAREDIAAILVSRPTNPTGNVLTRVELAKLDKLADKIGAWLIVDNAYGTPFPGVIEDTSELESVFYSDRTILSFSLSKIGIPGLRTGVIVAREDIIERLSAIMAVVGLANNSFGQRIAKPLFESGDILTISREIVQPFYHRRRMNALEMLKGILDEYGVEGRLHKSEGAFFLWLWLPQLKLGTKELYKKLKERGTLVIPGDEFFYGLETYSSEKIDPEFLNSRNKMLRISFSACEDVLEKGFRTIAETAREC